MKKFSKEEIEKNTGKYDEFGFYFMEDGSFYDKEGYYFDVEGYDDIGGYYDSQTAEYIPPPIDLIDGSKENDEDEYYDELIGIDEDIQEEDEDEDEEEDEQENYDFVNEKEAHSGIRREHCLPALKWLKE